MQQMIIFFAADFIGAWEIHCLKDLKKAFTNIENTIEIFNRFGMKLNNDKYIIPYDLQGREVYKFLNRRKLKRNKTIYFKFQ